MASTSVKREDANSVTVQCGDAEAIYLIKENRVLYDGQLISPTEFEKLGGRAAAKKWKQSVRVVKDGEDRGPIGAWFILNGIITEAIRPSSFGRPDRPGSSSSNANGPKFLGVGRNAPEITAAELIAHVEKQHIGYRLGDATCAELPETCEIKRDLVEVDLRTMPDNELDDLCAASCKDPFRDMLIKQPGVLQNKQAHFTGFEAKQQRKGPYIDDAVRAGSEFSAYLEGKGSLPEGARFPIVAGKPLDLQKLWQAVQAAGGYQRCTSQNMWTKIVHSLKIDTSISTNASYVIRTIYQKLLLDKEGQVKVENGLPLPVIEAKDESAQNQNQDQDQYIGLKDIKRQRISQSPSADSEKIDLTLSEDPESA